MAGPDQQPAPFSLAGQTALVTGAAKGIGAAIARLMKRQGASLILVDRDGPSVEALAEELGARALELDVGDVAAVEQAFAGLPPCSILVNNAGIDQHAFFTRLDPQAWQSLLAVNLLSVLATTRAVLPAMQDAGGGRIVNIVSEAGRLGSSGGSVYAAAKGGVIAFTRSIARENARFGITANCIAPGPVDTPLLRKAVEAGGERLMQAMAGATLVNRLGTPEEVAAAAVFLASPESSFITGETLGVSGGMGTGA